MIFNRIMVPVDYSEHSQRALELALQLRATEPLDVVHVLDRPTLVSDGLMVKQEDGSSRPLVDMIRENAEREMLEFLQRVSVPPGARLNHRVIQGESVTALVEELERRQVDLVVVGTHGRTGMSRILLGSVAEKLVRLSPVPVLIVPREK